MKMCDVFSFFEFIVRMCSFGKKEKLYEAELGSNILIFKAYISPPNKYWLPLETNRSWYRYYQNEVDK